MIGMTAALRARAQPLKDVWESRTRSYIRNAFHGDRIYQSMMLELIGGLHVTSFVETGTYFGDSARFIAERCPALPIFTCEVDEALATRARRRLKRFKNVQLTYGSSDVFVQHVVQNADPAGTLLLFLDAHWYDYWPLRDEISAIAEGGLKCVIVIDDFEVPGRPEFGFDVEGLDASRTSDRAEACGLGLVKPCLSDENTYAALLPAYAASAAFPGRAGALRGHLVMFQNLSKEYSPLVEGNELIGRHYERVDLLRSIARAEN